MRECIHIPLMPNGQGCRRTPCQGLKHVVPFLEIQAALEDMPSFQQKTHA